MRWSYQGEQLCTYVGSVDGGGPPEGEAAVGDLVQTRSLSVGQLLVLHRLFKTTGSFPEQHTIIFLQILSQHSHPHLKTSCQMHATSTIKRFFKKLEKAEQEKIEKAATKFTVSNHT